ncbi:hypothetical protein CVT24_010266 [Panaeolus cyanescens]|uniref:C2H2-type domain-containing protein n=1 Tax=Panaeolus cyanescens TaxID=181874 RepID=A0A409YPZ7_9AGAR|nr:hypothetical protein CVT24_010266 [Panaeolus cyanescens]
MDNQQQNTSLKATVTNAVPLSLEFLRDADPHTLVDFGFNEQPLMVRDIQSNIAYYLAQTARLEYDPSLCDLRDKLIQDVGAVGAPEPVFVQVINNNSTEKRNISCHADDSESTTVNISDKNAQVATLNASSSASTPGSNNVGAIARKASSFSIACNVNGGQGVIKIPVSAFNFIWAQRPNVTGTQSAPVGYRPMDVDNPNSDMDIEQTNTKTFNRKGAHVQPSMSISTGGLNNYRIAVGKNNTSGPIHQSSERKLRAAPYKVPNASLHSSSTTKLGSMHVFGPAIIRKYINVVDASLYPCHDRGYIQCRWDTCQERLPDRNALEKHLKEVHAVRFQNPDSTRKSAAITQTDGDTQGEGDSTSQKANAGASVSTAHQYSSKCLWANCNFPPISPAYEGRGLGRHVKHHYIFMYCSKPACLSKISNHRLERPHGSPCKNKNLLLMCYDRSQDEMEDSSFESSTLERVAASFHERALPAIKNSFEAAGVSYDEYM